MLAAQEAVLKGFRGPRGRGIRWCSPRRSPWVARGGFVVRGPGCRCHMARGPGWATVFVDPRFKNKTRAGVTERGCKGPRGEPGVSVGCIVIVEHVDPQFETDYREPWRETGVEGYKAVTRSQQKNKETEESGHERCGGFFSFFWFDQFSSIVSVVVCVSFVECR